MSYHTIYKLDHTILCLNVPLPCVDFMGFTMGNVGPNHQRSYFFHPSLYCSDYFNSHPVLHWSYRIFISGIM